MSPEESLSLQTFQCAAWRPVAPDQAPTHLPVQDPPGAGQALDYRWGLAQWATERQPSSWGTAAAKNMSICFKREKTCTRVYFTHVKSEVYFALLHADLNKLQSMQSLRYAQGV